MNAPDMQAAALAYATRFKWAVLPLHSIEDGRCTCGEGAACKSAGKHPRTEHGLSDATTDPATIRRWWQRWPAANVGVATGIQSGFVAVDIDPRNGGDISLEEIEREHGPFPHTVEALTGGGGKHKLFAITAPMEGYTPRRGIDLKADGGYIVAAPSLHISGTPYQWEASSRPDEVPLAPLNGFFQTTVKKGPAPPLPNIIREGERNNTLASLAGSMRRRGTSSEAILAALRVENRQRCQPPLDDAELEAVANSVARYDPAPTTAPTPQPTTPSADTKAPTPLEEIVGPLKSLTSWREAIAPPSVVPGLLLVGGVTWLSAATGVGKSLWTLSLLARIAAGTGETWLDVFKIPDRPTPCLLFDFECGEARLRYRIRCLVQGGDLTAAQADAAMANILLFDAVRFPSLLATEDTLTRLIDTYKVGVVVADPWRCLLPAGTDGNDPIAAAQVVFSIRRQLQQTGASGLVIDHDNRSGGIASGSQAKQDHADMVLHLKAESATEIDTLELHNLKPRDALIAAKVRFTRVRGDDAVSFKPEGHTKQDTPLRDRVLALLNQAADDGRELRQRDIVAKLNADRRRVSDVIGALKLSGALSGRGDVVFLNDDRFSQPVSV